MTQKRMVTLELDANAMTQVAVTVGSWDKLWGAIGYLSSWNLSYPYVTIFRDGATDLVAVYKDSSGVRQYTIGAVWHGAHYGYHS